MDSLVIRQNYDGGESLFAVGFLGGRLPFPRALDIFDSFYSSHFAYPLRTSWCCGLLLFYFL